jgi:hypothetical protein
MISSSWFCVYFFVCAISNQQSANLLLKLKSRGLFCKVSKEE